MGKRDKENIEEITEAKTSRKAESEGKPKGRGKRIFKETINAIFHGDLLLKLRLDKYIAHIVIVALAFAFILLSRCMVESAQVKRERMRAAIEEARLVNSQTNIELVGLGKMSTVERMLKENGVNVGKPEKPATMIEK